MKKSSKLKHGPVAIVEEKGLDKYEIENAARTLKEAEKIKQDKKLHAKAMEELKKEMKALHSIAALKEKAMEMGHEGDMEEDEEDSSEDDSEESEKA